MSQNKQKKNIKRSAPAPALKKKSPGPTTKKGVPLTSNFAAKTFGASAADRKNLRDIMSSPASKTVGCGLPPCNRVIETAVEDRIFQFLAKSIAFQLNDEVDYIPDVTDGAPRVTSAGLLYLYLKRCYASFAHRCGMLPMPAINADEMSLPGWVGIVFHMLAPHQDSDGASIGIRPTNFSVTELDGETVDDGLFVLEFENFSTQVIDGVQNGEELFSNGKLRTNISLAHMDDISTTISSLKKTVQVKNLATNAPTSSFYFNDLALCYDSSTPLEFFLSPYKLSAYFLGEDVAEWEPEGFTATEGALLALDAIKGVEYAKTKSFKSAFKEAGIQLGSLSVRKAVSNASWINSIAADTLLANNDLVHLDTATWWNTWNVIRVLWASYYLSFTPSVLLTMMTPGPGWKTSNHRQAYVTPQLAMTQKSGFYRHKNTIIAVVPPASAKVLINQFTTTSLNYSLVTPAAFDVTYFEGTLASPILPPVVVGAPPGTQYFNYLPMGVYDSYDSVLKFSNLRFQRIPNPKLHHCLCIAGMIKSADTFDVQGITIHYISIGLLACNYRMSTELCCWMYAGCMVQEATGNLTAKFRLLTSDRSNHLRVLASACALRGSAAISAGQSEDPGKSFVNVVRNEIMEKVKTGIVEIPMQQLIKQAKEYVGQQIGNNFDVPSEEQVWSVLTGQAPLATTLSILGSGILTYGARILLGLKSVRVRTEL